MWGFHLVLILKAFQFPYGFLKRSAPNRRFREPEVLLSKERAQENWVERLITVVVLCSLFFLLLCYYTLKLITRKTRKPIHDVIQCRLSSIRIHQGLHFISLPHVTTVYMVSTTQYKQSIIFKVFPLITSACLLHEKSSVWVWLVVLR